MASNGIPQIDVAPMLAGDPAGKRRIAEQVGDALETIGFFTIVGHGVPESVVRDARDAAYEFFALPLAEKMRVPRPSVAATRGYDPPANQKLAATLGNETPPDLQEMFGMGDFDLPDRPYYTEGHGKDFFSPNLWPERPARMRPACEAYYRALGGIGDALMRIFALALGIDERFFDDKIARSISHIRFNKYMAQTEAPKPGQLRAGAHTDYGTLTILYGEDRPGGLQARSPDGGWVDVRPASGAFVVNIGDMMARWTNDRWVSTLHRVVNPPRSEDRAERLSIAFFHQPGHDVEIRCIETCHGPGNPIRHPPVTYGDYRFEKVLSSRIAGEAASPGDAKPVPFPNKGSR